MPQLEVSTRCVGSPPNARIRSADPLPTVAEVLMLPYLIDPGTARYGHAKKCH
jgi:hypothetical protein